MTPKDTERHDTGTAHTAAAAPAAPGAASFALMRACIEAEQSASQEFQARQIPLRLTAGHATESAVGTPTPSRPLRDIAQPWDKGAAMRADQGLIPAVRSGSR